MPGCFEVFPGDMVGFMFNARGARGQQFQENAALTPLRQVWEKVGEIKA